MLNIDSFHIVDVCVQPVKLLGVMLDEHLKFHSHVKYVIERTRPSIHANIKLERAGVDPLAIALFYRASALSVISYAAPCWFSHLERHQKLCTRIMLPDVEHYECQRK